MNIGIILEGDDDYETYPVLIRKCRQDIDRVYARKCRGRRPLKTKFVCFLKEFESNPAIQIDKAIVICDSDCDDPRKLEQQLEQILRESGVKLSFSTHFHATKCMLENLLLADEEAISKVAQKRGRVVQKDMPVGNLESLKEAKAVLSKRLSEARLPASSRVFAEIAEASDLAKILERCSHFRDFVQKTNAC